MGARPAASRWSGASRARCSTASRAARPSSTAAAPRSGSARATGRPRPDSDRTGGRGRRPPPARASAVADEVVLFGAPPGMFRLLGRAPERLRDAHPRVRVEIVADADGFAARLPSADAVIVSGFPIPPAALAPGGRLRWIQSVHVGVDDLLTPALLAAGHVTLTASKGPMAAAIAEHALMLMLALARDLPRCLADQAACRWVHWSERPPMVQLRGKTVLILGLGELGGALARMCKLGLGMRVVGMSRRS